MLLQNTSDLITEVSQTTLPSGIQVDVAQLINGAALVLSEQALALYRNAESVGDALGNGLIRSIDLPLTLEREHDRYLQEHKAGYVGLSGGIVLLITLNDVQMFPSRNDALRNQNELTRMSLAF